MTITDATSPVTTTRDFVRYEPMPPDNTRAGAFRASMIDWMNNPRGGGAFRGRVLAVEDIDAATEQPTDTGGTVVRAPMEGPGGAFVAQTTDPQGIFVSPVGLRGAA